MRRAGIVISVVAALGLSLASPAMAIDYGPGPDVTCHTDSVQAGGSLALSGSNWLPESTVVLTFQSDPVLLGTTQTDSNGTFQETVQIPSDASVGEHQIVANGLDQNGERATATCAIAVTAGAGPGGGVAFTGTNVSLGLIILGVLVVGGLGFMAAGRRRKAHVDR